MTAFAAAAARADFRRARRRQRVADVSRRLGIRRPGRSRPRHLGDLPGLFWAASRRRSILLDAVVGTVDPSTDFDASFRPATDRVAGRWESIACAHRAGRSLPPIAVIERPDGFYVLDGRHRVSVARALGLDRIEASAAPSVHR
jgi:hypothetical protein